MSNEPATLPFSPESQDQPSLSTEMDNGSKQKKIKKNGDGENESVGTDSSENEYDFTTAYLAPTQAPKEFKLPETVTVLEGPHGSKVYLIGTAHFSEKSWQDVEQVIRHVRPNVVVLELCKSRLYILEYDEKTVLEEVKNMGVSKIRSNINQYGFVQGIISALLISLSAQLAKHLGMLPGGEFRTAFREAKQIPGCVIHLGDRPVHITLTRGISSLNFWQKMKLIYSILSNNESISKEEIERCKEKSSLDQMLNEMAQEYPPLSKVFVDERNTYLTYSLQLAASPIPCPQTKKLVPSVVVGVVGIGHVPGIKECWGKVTDADIPPLLKIPEKSLTSKIVEKSVKISVLSIMLWAGYRYLAPKSLTNFISSMPNRVQDLFIK
ncbi:traB domain-containing protein [Tetranychus urticae]|uniref:TraB domain-containing protein n=1 Tax=Tetranychus urticae TaxID=32264 RepID=T1K9J9_TETUR|nr:traB domain-containing protein [Tetranychus urticae]